MRKTKSYSQLKFPAEIIKKVFVLLNGSGNGHKSFRYKVGFDNESWHFDTFEEFITEYRKDCLEAYFKFSLEQRSIEFHFFRNHKTHIEVEGQDRNKIHEVFEFFDDYYEGHKVSVEEIENSKKELLKKTIKVFIGHGRSQQWRDLKDHLQDKMGFTVLAYETGSRAGYTITEVLEELSKTASIAFLVHTAEDLDKDHVFHARENVIHETGLFQGKLGVKKAIIILEEGTKEYTNISGVQQLRYTAGNIKEVFGEVISIIYREFKEAVNGV